MLHPVLSVLFVKKYIFIKTTVDCRTNECTSVRQQMKITRSEVKDATVRNKKNETAKYTKNEGKVKTHRTPSISFVTIKKNTYRLLKNGTIFHTSR